MYLKKTIQMAYLWRYIMWQFYENGHKFFVSYLTGRRVHVSHLLKPEGLVAHLKLIEGVRNDVAWLTRLSQKTQCSFALHVGTLMLGALSPPPWKSNYSGATMLWGSQATERHFLKVLQLAVPDTTPMSEWTFSPFQTPGTQSLPTFESSCLRPHTSCIRDKPSLPCRFHSLDSQNLWV